MKICYISEYFSPDQIRQFKYINSITDICKLKKIQYIVIFKKSEIYLNKKKLESSISKCDIVHLIGGWTSFYMNISLLAHKLKKKIIFHPMDFNETLSLTPQRIKKYIAWNLYQKKILLKADLIHCTSIKEAQNLKRLNSNFKTVILPFGIDKKNISTKINKKITKKCLFFSGFNKEIELDKLLKSWSYINNSNWQLDIIGSKNLKNYKEIYNLDKHKKIRFLKLIYRKNLKFRIFDKYDFLVIPSAKKNFDFVMIEALARGLPILTINETSWNIIQDKNSGLIINNSLIELKLALHQIFNLSDKKLLIKKKNAIKIAKKFTKNNLSGLYFKTYQKILNS